MTGVALAATLFVGFGSLSLLFTDDPAVLDVARSGVWVLIILRNLMLSFSSSSLHGDFMLNM